MTTTGKILEIPGYAEILVDDRGCRPLLACLSARSRCRHGHWPGALLRWSIVVAGTATTFHPGGYCRRQTRGSRFREGARGARGAYRGWKRSNLVMVTAVKRPGGETREKVAAGPHARNRHRASPPTLNDNCSILGIHVPNEFNEASGVAVKHARCPRLSAGNPSGGGAGARRGRSVLHGQ